MYNPVEIAEITEKIACKNNRRKYYRFRPARFYGGISTADCFGCILRCVFCWSVLSEELKSLITGGHRTIRIEPSEGKSHAYIAVTDVGLAVNRIVQGSVPKDDSTFIIKKAIFLSFLITHYCTF